MRFALLVLLVVLSGVVPSALAQVASLTPHVVSTCNADVRFDRYAPMLARALTSDPSVYALVAEYACLARPDAVQTMDDLLVVVALRDSVIARAAPVVEEWHDSTEHADPQAVFDGLFDEAEALALRMVQAEGMITGVTFGGFDPHVLSRAASPDLRLALHLRAFEGQTMGGEYPFSDLSVEADLLAAAERMRRDFPASPYLAWSQDALGRALTTLASLHPVRGIEGEQWFAMPATNDYWPWAADRSALEHFVELATDSRYHAPLAAILADPPESATEGDLDLLVVSRDATWESAQARTLAWLDGGIDVVGPVELGERDMAVLYRYYPAGDARLDAAAARARAQGLTVERVRVDVAELWGF